MEEMHKLLKTEEFHQHVHDFIKANLRAYVPGLEMKESVKSIPNEMEIAYSRPPNPDAENYATELASFECHVARAKQLHSCEVH